MNKILILFSIILLSFLFVMPLSLRCDDTNEVHHIEIGFIYSRQMVVEIDVDGGDRNGGTSHLILMPNPKSLPFTRCNTLNIWDYDTSKKTYPLEELYIDEKICRKKIVEELSQILNDFDPEVFEEFNQKYDKNLGIYKALEFETFDDPSLIISLLKENGGIILRYPTKSLPISEVRQ